MGLGLHGHVRPFVGMGAGSVARHCTPELIFVWGPFWLRIGLINFTCTANDVAGGLESPCDSVIQENAPRQECRLPTRRDQGFTTYATFKFQPLPPRHRSMKQTSPCKSRAKGSFAPCPSHCAAGLRRRSRVSAI